MIGQEDEDEEGRWFEGQNPAEGRDRRHLMWTDELPSSAHPQN
jgi:hypothetical protein